MIVKILSNGKSFKGLANYLTHDPNAGSAERVGFTHTLNCAHDHVPSAVDEMVWTARDAELLKQEAGIRAGGRATENPVKHVSLNWAPGKDPTREHMIRTSESFLQHMGWQDHQAVIVAHEDKAYSHVHIMLNTVHPETGLRLDDNFERRRAQKWALAYEQEQGRIHCEERLKNPEERTEAPTRPAWQAFQQKQQEFTREENARREQTAHLNGDPENPENPQGAEWKKLKDMQRHERERFFADGKSAFSQVRSGIYHEVRDEFRGRWSEFFAAQKDGLDPAALAQQKAELIAEQKAVLEGRRDEACDELRDRRDTAYREILDGQRSLRHELRDRQAAELDNTAFFRGLEETAGSQDTRYAFRDAAEEVGARQDGRTRGTEETQEAPAQTSPASAGLDMGTDVAAGIGGGLLSFFGSALSEFVNGAPSERAPRQAADNDAFAAAADAAVKRQYDQREEEERQWRERERTRVWD